MHDPSSSLPVRLVTGGTRAQDVMRLRALLAERLVARGLVEPGEARPQTSRLPVLVPVGPQEDPVEAEADMCRRLRGVPPGTDLVLRTSGSSTGTGRLVAVSARSLVASARATHARLGAAGRWVLALPAHHVAGLQVLVRSVLAGTAPLVVDTSTGFRVPALAGALHRALRGRDPVYLSLVPTQLVRALQDEETTRLLSRTKAVLLGGAATSPTLLSRARAAGTPLVTTYGASETAGGCVYDGLPLDGVEVALDAEDRILLRGPVLASGYVGDGSRAGACDIQQGARYHGAPLAGGTGQGAARQEDSTPLWRPGTRLPVALRPGFHLLPTALPGELPDEGGTGTVRVLATSDRGRLEDGRLVVLGRADGLINTGGVKVDPREVEDVLTGIEEVAEACVVGVPDQEWGTVVAAAVVLQPGAVLDGGAVRRCARERLGGTHAPKRVEVLDSLPLRGPGKVDRRAVQVLLSRS
ncbi:AMP-binding protein [Actinomyces wuliandei]|uniref:AMP-binding protein n=1 Tax=Actinomyces wuliandei TaxID=2057743 RepID=UPI001FA963FF|nr:AMP-binding protein [Actinomyces wuliandei]